MSSKKIVEDWVAKYGNNPEVDKIINERLKYMENKNMTAVEWLYIKMYTHRGNITVEEYEQAKAMEKEHEYETKVYWFGRGILAGRENRIDELQPKQTNNDGE